MAEEFRLGRLTLVDDVSAADWVRQRIGEFGGGVGLVVPRGFAAYARVFHPAARASGDDTEETPIRWQEVAAANGRRAHPAMEWTVPQNAGTLAGGASRLSFCLTTPRRHHRREVGGRRRADLVGHTPA